MTLKKILKKGVVFLFIISFLNSCVPRRKIAFFQNYKTKNSRLIAEDQLIILQSQDRLTINVSAQEQEAAIPFNLPLVATTNSRSFTQVNAGATLQSYVVNSEGNIDFPILGKVKVAGLSIEQLKLFLTSEIVKYVKNPIVSVELTNFKITILGEVNRPGTYTIDDQSINLPKALGLANDMTIFGKRKNILIIREESFGEVTRNYLDITSSKIMDSPYYNLRQNDIIYVEPNKAQRQGASFNRNHSLYVSIASVLISLAILFGSN